MAEPRFDRFAPPLMQAFRDAARARDSRKVADERDESGDRVIAGRRNSARRATNVQALRRELNDDLLSLLNTVNLESSENLAARPYVARSILNFGFSDLSSLTVDEVGVDGLAQELAERLKTFEPRLVASTIEVEKTSDSESPDARIRFLIRADMHATPIDVPVEFVADVDVDTAKMKISRL